jgi:hypothetical protein
MARCLTYLLGCLLSGLSVALAQRYVEISAEIDLVTYGKTDTNGAASGSHRIISCVCIVGTNEWRIDNDYSQNAEIKWFFDGTNIYDSARITKPLPPQVSANLAKRFGFGSPPFDVARSNITINIHPSPNGHPIGDEGVNLPWLAFCSGTYLKREARLIALPVAVLRHTPEGFGYSDKTQVFEDELGLPRTVDLFLSKALLESSVSNFNSEHFIGFRKNAENANGGPLNSQDGAPQFHYEVTESTNFMGWNFPLRFEFAQSKRAVNGYLHPAYSGTGRVNSIRSSAKPENLFVPSMHQTVGDYRFREERKTLDAIVYPTTNAYAEPTNDSGLQNVFKEQVRQMPSAPVL